MAECGNSLYPSAQESILGGVAVSVVLITFLLVVSETGLNPHSGGKLLPILCK